MKCSCGGDFRITNTYSGGKGSKTASAVCTSCACRATLVEFLAFEAPENGKGAWAIAAALRRGEVAPKLEPRPEPPRAP